MSTFRLPPKPLAPVNPRRLSARVLKLAPKAAPQEPETRALDMWEPDFAGREALDALAALGCTLPDRPCEDPDMPADVTMLSNEQLGLLHGQFSAFAVYLGSQLGLAVVAASEQKAYLAHISAEIRLRKAGTVKDKDSKTLNDARFIESEMELLRREAKVELLKARMFGYRDFKETLSREISRRQGNNDA